jgi:hypothetical protein
VGGRAGCGNDACREQLGLASGGAFGELAERKPNVAGDQRDAVRFVARSVEDGERHARSSRRISAPKSA